jgi:hypothetical protein
LINYDSFSNFWGYEGTHLEPSLNAHVEYRDVYQKHTSEHSSVNVQKKLNSELQKIQAFFHPEMFESMMKVNSLKGRVEFENGTTEKETWSALAAMFNGTEPDELLDHLELCLDYDEEKGYDDEKGHLVKEETYNNCN